MVVRRLKQALFVDETTLGNDHTPTENVSLTREKWITNQAHEHSIFHNLSTTFFQNEKPRCLYPREGRGRLLILCYPLSCAVSRAPCSLCAFLRSPEKRDILTPVMRARLYLLGSIETKMETVCLTYLLHKHPECIVLQSGEC